jgi:hypothetical protein
MLNNAFILSGCLSSIAIGLIATSSPVAAQQINRTKAGVTVFDEGRRSAVVVVPDQPLAAVQYAAEELVYHLEKATGARLSIVKEDTLTVTDNGPRIYLGDTRAARAAGINGPQLPLENFKMRTGNNAIFIVGNDAAGDPLDRDTSAGTLFGVYEWMERELGVRWVWPGELGTFVPKTRTVIARPVDMTVAPRFLQRHVRPGLSFTSANPALGFTPKAAEEYAKVQTIHLRRNRMGRNVKLTYRHAFTDWWEKYGEEHPEWFQLVNGKRGPVSAGKRYSMCVSNPEFHKKIVELWKEQGGAQTGNVLSSINVVENDIPGLCECENCRAWDGPVPADYATFTPPSTKIYGLRYVTGRYARFAKAVQELAAKENPNVVAIGYAYQNYFNAPSDVKLNDNIMIGFCPSAWWYPRMDDEHVWMKKQWSNWRDTGVRLFTRTNYFLDGYNMPYIFAHQFADDFQHMYRNGMIATDYDSLTGHWSTQGPNLYLLMRLHTRPDAKADDLLAEYYSAFGPAASQVKAYFDYWEKYTMDSRPVIFKAFDYRESSRWRVWAKAANTIFPEECFAPGESILEKALVEATGNAEATARVKFLQNGLTHAKLSSRAAGRLTLIDPESTPERGRKELDELLLFRRAHEKEWLGNFNHLSWVEDLSWKLPNEAKQPAELYP